MNNMSVAELVLEIAHSKENAITEREILETAVRERCESFAQFIQGELAKIDVIAGGSAAKQDAKAKIQRANAKVNHLIALALALDGETNMGDFYADPNLTFSTKDTKFRDKLDRLLSFAEILQDLGVGPPVRVRCNPLHIDAHDTVGGWYTKSLFTGFDVIDPAAIVPSRSKLIRYWGELCKMWPAPYLDRQPPSLDDPEESNYLGLDPIARVWWDRQEFGLRPIMPDGGENNGNTKLCVQLWWLLESFDRNTGLVLKRDWVGLGMVDRRFPGRPSYVQSGATITLYSEDPHRKPMPDFRLLQAQWLIRKVISSLYNIASLRTIFSEIPPEILTADDADDIPTREWGSLLQLAMDAGVLSPGMAQAWADASGCQY